ncbi:MAG: Mov34/MPN/PAD-1 family protein [Candidatus Heimdallarchaeota archaeon]|nr:MAG: Mov34/MPN/PAD-1 family protein [Candidatus Heimdallarchaeota archaeon]
MIRIPKIVYEKFLRFALENANPLDSRDWKECIGLVLGRIKEEEILVTDIVPIGSGTAVFVDIADYEKVFSLISPSRIDHGEVIVGWAHTHPGLGLFLSGTDIHTQQMYQQMHPKAFALVLDPTKISPEFSGFNIFRLDEFGSNPTTVDYSFDEHCDFFTIRETLISELYLVPPVLKPPAIISESEVLWNGIRIILSGDKESLINQFFQVKLVVDLPFRQFIRIEYQTETDNVTDNPFTRKLLYQKILYHETITSGTLGIFSFRPTNIGTVHFRINNIFLTDYRQSLQKMPDLQFKTEVQGK